MQCLLSSLAAACKDPEDPSLQQKAEDEQIGKLVVFAV